MDAERRKPSMMSLRLDEEVQESLRARAEAKGIPASAAVREAIELWLTLQDQAVLLIGSDSAGRPLGRRDDVERLNAEQRDIGLARAQLTALEDKRREFLHAHDRTIAASQKAQHRLQTAEAEVEAADEARSQAASRCANAREQLEMTKHEVMKIFAERALLERQLYEITAKTEELTKFIEAQTEAPRGTTSKEERGGIW